jgi:hypothetical protein
MSPLRDAALAATALLLLDGCQGKRAADAPWLTMPGVAAHAAWFPIGPADVHGAPPGQPPPCDSCHQDKATGQPSGTFRTFTCTGCHVAVRAGVFHDQSADLATFHAAVAGYASTVARYAPRVAALQGGVGPQAPEDGACLECHPTGLTVDHAARFPLPHQDASGTQVATCGDCHTTTTARNDPASLACETCHLGLDATLPTKHASPAIPVTDYSTAKGFAAASARCLYCHGDAQVNRTAGHPVGEGTPWGNASHRVAGCATCHATPLTDKPFAADWGSRTCVTAACHAGGLPP